MQPLAQAVPGALAALLRDVPLSAAKVTFAWRAAVGATLGRTTSVHLDHGVLLVDAASPQWGREITRSSSLILTRLRALLGDATIHRIVVREP
jgi:hypothetical protein